MLREDGFCHPVEITLAPMDTMPAESWVMEPDVAYEVPSTLDQLSALITRGEGPSLEFKRSTGELKEGLQTLCAFKNGQGGLILFGVGPDAKVEGQQVSDKTLRDIAQALDRFDPPIHLHPERLAVGNGREVLILQADGASDSIPFSFEGRAYERLGSTTRQMAREQYEKLLLERMHNRRRWENLPAYRVTPRDLDREEVYHILRIAASLGRLSHPIGNNLGDTLDRLHLRQDGQVIQAAVVLFGKNFMPDFPQCELRMARFRGDENDEFLDQRMVRGPAFKLLQEAELFCQRHFPMPAKIVEYQMRRVEKPLIPVKAMREILVNAFIHRDYSIAGGAVSLAIYDDRVEIWSAGTFPRGITPRQLSRKHLSVQRNPIIADMFHRAGLIEKWGRGTNRVITMCKDAGIAPPTFEEITGGAVVTFKVKVGQTVEKWQQPESQSESRPESGPESLETRILGLLQTQPLGKQEISDSVGHRKISGELKKVLRRLLEEKLIAYTLPKKPNSRLQKYRLTRAGLRRKSPHAP